MEVAVVSNLVSFHNDSPHEIRPAFCVRSQYEECCLHSGFGERIENLRSRFRVRAVVECEGYLASRRRQFAEHRPEYPAVTVKRSVSRTAEQGQPDCRGREDHTAIALLPS